nr:MAG TPA: hypothetical protein [Caudoviricetes sp.]
MARFSFPHKLSLAIFDRLSSADIAYAGVPGFPVGQFISSHLLWSRTSMKFV